MSSLERSAFGWTLLLVVYIHPGEAAQGPKLGTPLEAQDISTVAITVMPDGEGLPEGGGTASEGAAVYARHCQPCHGIAGAGGPNDALAGGHGSLATRDPVRTIGSYWPYATTIFDYVRRAMPYQAPGSLSANETYAVTAFLLFANGIIAEDQEMNAATLPAVRMPNREGFVPVVGESQAKP